MLVVTHADRAIPLAELAAPSATRPLFEHAKMQPLIADVAARTGVNANQVSTGSSGGVGRDGCCEGAEMEVSARFP